MLETVYESDGLRVAKYAPTALKPFYVDMEPTTLLRRLRFLIDLHYGYSVYYLMEGEAFLGYCAITSGKNPRFWFAGDGDIIVGPYFVDKGCRGRGLATALVDIVLKHCETDWRRAFVSIKNSNAASIRVTEKLGGRLLFHVRNTRLKRLVKSESGDYGIYEITPGR